jgi:hypothetical protein
MADDLNVLPYAVRVAGLARHPVRFNVGLAVGLKLLPALGGVAGTVSLLVAVLVGDIRRVAGSDAERYAARAPEAERQVASSRRPTVRRLAS